MAGDIVGSKGLTQRAAQQVIVAELLILVFVGSWFGSNHSG